MYCFTMWYSCTVTAMKRLRIAYNNSLRRLLGIPKHNSASEMSVQLTGYEPAGLTVPPPPE